jgi:hypothetical protein
MENNQNLIQIHWLILISFEAFYREAKLYFFNYFNFSAFKLFKLYFSQALQFLVNL